MTWESRQFEGVQLPDSFRVRARVVLDLIWLKSLPDHLPWPHARSKDPPWSSRRRWLLGAAGLANAAQAATR